MIVLTGGAFDIIHYAHIHWLQRAAKYGYLIVIIASDEQIKSKKGKTRPIISQKNRAKVVKAIKGVEEVYLMKGLYDIEKILDDTSPDILILTGNTRKEAKICKERGIKLIKFPCSKSVSTSKIISSFQRR